MLGEAIEFLFPVGIGIHSSPGGFDQGRSKVPASGLGDATLSEGLPGGVHAGAKTGIPDRLFGRFETGNIAEGRENGHPQDYTDAGYLNSECHEIPPLGGIAEGYDLSVELPDQRFEMVEDIQVVAKEDFLHGRNRDGIPPWEVPVGERFAGR